MRLNKYLARAGVASRRKSEEFILAGRVSVNGQAMTDMSYQVDEAHDKVALDGVELSHELKHTTLLLNKPKGYITSKGDPFGRPSVDELVPYDEYPGLSYVGRLDNDTQGVLLFTTDGELAHSLLHPSKEVAKRYSVLAAGVISNESLLDLHLGITLDDGPIAASEVKLISTERVTVQDKEGRDKEIAATRLEVVISEGRKRIVRRMLSAVGHRVLELDRISFAGLGYGSLERGAYRILNDEEVSTLKEVAGL